MFRTFLLPIINITLSVIYSEGQSDSIVQDIENMVRAFIEKVNAPRFGINFMRLK